MYQKVKHDGIIIFDNSDMQSHDEGQIFLEESGFSRLDFWGLVPLLFVQELHISVLQNFGDSETKSDSIKICLISRSFLRPIHRQFQMKNLSPEIINDEFSEWIRRICAEENVNTIIEIGASSGEGSTQQILKGVSLSQTPNKYSV